MKRDLNWGETPWDDMPREELVRETQRFYAAIVEAKSILGQSAYGRTAMPFWSSVGMGGRALARATKALEPYEGKWPGETPYRAFFRYAVDLLFPGMGAGWHICDACGFMLGSSPDGTPPAGCIDCAYKGRTAPPLRPIEWRDLNPKRAAERSGA